MFKMNKKCSSCNLEKCTNAFKTVCSLMYRQTRTIKQYPPAYKGKDHYSSLGISPKSTQADIKAAYYKLSMVYHPDKSDTAEHSKKFRAITEAYEVLGNVKTRKLYDRGLLVRGPQSTYSPPDQELENKFYRSRDLRHRPPPPTGKTPIYDFDEWARNHYEATFNLDRENKRRYERHRQDVEFRADAKKWESVILGTSFVLLFCMTIFNYLGNSHDVPVDIEQNLNNTKTR